MEMTTVQPYPDTLFIDGRRVRGEGPEIAVENPATEEIIATVRSASIAQVDEAIASARRALSDSGWSDPAFRAACLERLAGLVEAEAEALTTIAVNEVGTPVTTVRALNVSSTALYFRHAAKLAQVDRRADLGENAAAFPSRSLVTYRPIGVVGAIAPYNLPLLISAAKLANIWAAGCTAVLLPSNQAPLALLKLGQLAHAAGVPAGALNVIAGGPEVGEALTSHPGIDKVSFTGSVNTGRLVMTQAARHLTGVTLELGGKSAAILLPGTDFAPLAATIHARYLRNAGQGCGATTRILVERSRIDEFIEVSRRAYADVKVGDPWDPDVLVGPLISRRHRDWAEDFVARAVAQGAEIAAGGGRNAMARGHFMNPVLLTNVSNRDEVAQEELFAPVAAIIPYGDVDEAIAIANDSQYGLGGAVFGDTELALQVAQRLETGTVTINGGGGLRPEAPLCGYKYSGVGSESGEDGVREFLKPQHLQWRL